MTEAGSITTRIVAGCVAAVLICLIICAFNYSNNLARARCQGYVSTYATYEGPARTAPDTTRTK
jgi:hypothetical protein